MFHALPNLVGTRRVASAAAIQPPLSSNGASIAYKLTARLNDNRAFRCILTERSVANDPSGQHPACFRNTQIFSKIQNSRENQKFAPRLPFVDFRANLAKVLSKKAIQFPS